MVLQGALGGFMRLSLLVTTTSGALLMFSGCRLWHKYLAMQRIGLVFGRCQNRKYQILGVLTQGRFISLMWGDSCRCGTLLHPGLPGHCGLFRGGGCEGGKDEAPAVTCFSIEVPQITSAHHVRAKVAHISKAYWPGRLARGAQSSLGSPPCWSVPQWGLMPYLNVLLGKTYDSERPNYP